MLSKSLRHTCVATLLVMLAPLACAAPQYFVTSPAGSKYARALALNDVGQYAVNSFGPEIPYQGGSINGPNSGEGIGSLGGYVTQIRAINNLGEAVGVSSTATGEFHSFLYSDGRMQDLTARYGIQDVNDINDRGEIAGRTLDYRAAILRGGVLDAFGPDHSGSGDMNGRGELLVGYQADGLSYRTAVYRNGTLTDLPRIGGREVFAQAINDAGWVTGYFTGATGRNHAFVWDGQTYTNLTPWAVNSLAFDINKLGQVVGVTDGHPFLYADGELIDLNTRIDPDADLLLISADEINDRTQILAPSCDRTGVFCYGSTLLTPVPGVPEPSLVAMLSIGLALLSVARLRRSLRIRRMSGRAMDTSSAPARGPRPIAPMVKHAGLLQQQGHTPQGAHLTADDDPGLRPMPACR